MKIKGIEAIHLKLPPRQDYRWAGLLVGLGDFLLVKIQAENGRIGYGETVPLIDWGGDYHHYYGESPQTARHVIHDYLAPVLVGENLFGFEAAHTAMDRVVKGHPYAKAAIEIALYDLAGKLLEVPVYQLLGGKVREKIPIAHMLGLMAPAQAIPEAERVAAEGIRAFQVKGGLDINRDIQLISALRARLGDQINLRLDANQGYPTPKVAIQAIRRMEADGLNLVEQPVEGISGLAQVTAAVSCLVIADESVWTPQDALTIAQTHAVDALSIYIGKAGGLLKAKKISDIAEAARLRCDVNGSLELGVGNAANLHLAAATKVIDLANVIPINGPAGQGPTEFAGRYFADDIVREPFKYADGFVIISDQPGLGVEVDEAKIERYRVA